MIRAVIRTLIAVFLTLPFLTLIWKLEDWGFPQIDEALRALLFTFEQAAISAALSVLVGFWGAQGLLRWPTHKRWLEILFLVPNLFPTLFVLLACLKFFDPFPFGLVGIILIHVVLNSGLCAVAISRIFESKVGGWAELSWIEGASKRLFLPVAIRHLKRDLLILFLFVFSLCFASLTVPLVAGRFNAVTTELLIYEKVKISNEWSQALGLSILQTVLILIFSLLLSREHTLWTSTTKNLHLLSSRWGLLLPFLFSLIVVGSQFEGISIGLTQFSQISGDIPQAVAGTFIVGAGVGGLSLILFALIIFSSPHKIFQRFLVGYVAPSSVLTGFALLILDFSLSPLARIILGITLVQLPLFYRLYVDGAFESLGSQIQVARTLGSDWKLLFKKVTWPQMAKPIGFAAGLSAFWACGEFALSSLLTAQNLTLALTVRNLIFSYRLEAATLILWILLACGVTLWLLFWSLGHGLSSKSHS
jgi:thiamine transport system permease protein